MWIEVDPLGVRLAEAAGVGVYPVKKRIWEVAAADLEPEASGVYYRLGLVLVEMGDSAGRLTSSSTQWSATRAMLTLTS